MDVAADDGGVEIQGSRGRLQGTAPGGGCLAEGGGLLRVEGARPAELQRAPGQCLVIYHGKTALAAVVLMAAGAGRDRQAGRQLLAAGQ